MKIINKLFDINKEIENIVLIGCPNVGKSTIFNSLTWKNSPVSNYDRLTTNFYEGTLKNNKNINIVDLPGITSLNPIGDDEKDSIDFIFNNKAKAIFNILNANSLSRDLYLTIELAEAGLLNYIVINMADELDKNHEISTLKLTNFFKVPSILISSKNRTNTNELKYAISVNNFRSANIELKYNEKIEGIIKECSILLNDRNFKLSNRFLITQFIIKNQYVINFFKNLNLDKEIQKIIEKYDLTDNEIEDINNKKLALINKITNAILKVKKPNNNIYKINWIDRVLLNPWFAIPIFILVIALIYFLTFYQYTGGYLQSLLANDGLGKLQEIIHNQILSLNPSNTQEWYASFVSDGLLGGIFTVISFLPWIIILFLLTTILEQIGFLSRMAVVFDHIFSKFGLSGRSIVSLITGIGCNVPSILLAKNSNSIKEKVVSIFISPFVSCSARIVVFGYLGIAIFGTNLNWLLSVMMTIISVVIALVVGYFFSNIWFRKTNTIFITELPKYRGINLNSLVKKIFNEVYSFIKRTILIVGLANFIIWFLMHTSPTTIFLNNPYDLNNKSFLWYIAYPFNYILYPLGLGYDWRFSISLLSALPAKEIIASNIDLMFGNINDFSNQISQSSNLVIPILFSYLFFICFYIPCFATLTTMKKEIGLKYMLIHIVFSLLFAYSFSFIVFTIFSTIQIININDHYYVYLEILISLVSIFIFVLILLKITKLYLINKNYLIIKGLKNTYKSIVITSNILLIGCLIAMNILILLK